MQDKIHPKYFEEAKIKCACGNEWQTGATYSDMQLEICSQCHPFYSGKEKLLDARGRINKFKERASKAQPKKQ
jgi:large subunit ribosomal protein L31